MSSTNSINLFSRSKTLEDLEFAYEIMTSPENISHDGERSRADVNAAYKRINADLVARRYEIILGTK